MYVVIFEFLFSFFEFWIFENDVKNWQTFITKIIETTKKETKERNGERKDCSDTDKAIRAWGALYGKFKPDLLVSVIIYGKTLIICLNFKNRPISYQFHCSSNIFGYQFTLSNFWSNKLILVWSVLLAPQVLPYPQLIFPFPKLVFFLGNLLEFSAAEIT